MKILVTGGAGFIGSHVVEAYLSQGHEVLVLDDLSSGRRENLPPGVRLIEADVRQKTLASELVGLGIEVVNHHAAQISVPASVADPGHDANINLLGLVTMLQAALAWGTKRFIFISSGGAVYGEPRSLPVAEDHPMNPGSPYAVSKQAGELYLGYFASRGLSTVTLRYANVYGPRQIPQGEAGVVSVFMQALLDQLPPTIYRYEDMPEGMLRDYVFVKDCAAANLLALTAGRGAYNIGTGLATSTMELWRAVQRAAGRLLEHDFGPARPGDLRQSALDSIKVAAELGWVPAYDLARGLAKTWAWRLTRE
ncbi:putative UDP-glucose 4-epimerase [Desulfarculales bacterium]